jgi:hypothetical protein
MAGKKGTERNFGTVEALAFAFILGFLPRGAVQSGNLRITAIGSPIFLGSDPLPIILFQ